MGLRVLVCGGRNYSDEATVDSALDFIHKKWDDIDVLIDGGATGADTLCRDWAYRNEVETRTFMADWKKHGKAAGPIRNQQMLDEGKPHMLVAFPGGRGTADMVSRAKKAGVTILEIQEKEQA